MHCTTLVGQSAPSCAFLFNPIQQSHSTILLTRIPNQQFLLIRISQSTISVDSDSQSTIFVDSDFPINNVDLESTRMPHGERARRSPCSCRCRSEGAPLWVSCFGMTPWSVLVAFEVAGLKWSFAIIYITKNIIYTPSSPRWPCIPNTRNIKYKRL
jgi:hypothetical protein